MAKNVRLLQRSGLYFGLLFAVGCLPLQREEPGPGTEVNAFTKDPRVARMQLGETPRPAAPVNNVAYPSPPVPATPELSPYRVRICAYVNGKPLFEAELYNMASHDIAETLQFPEPERSVKRQEALKKRLQELIDQEVVLQDALRKLEKNQRVLDKLREIAGKQYEKQVHQMRTQSGLSDYEFKRQMQRQGMSLDAMKRQVERRFIVSEYMRNRVFPETETVGHRQILDYFNQHRNEFATVDRVEWENIFVAAGTQAHPTLAHARQRAQEVAQRLQAGEPVVNLVKYDDGDSATRQGKGYGQRRGEIKPAAIEPYLFTMQAGQVGPLVELSTGVHVFRLRSRENAGQMEFTEDIQARIRNKLKNDIATREYQRIIRELSSRTVIEVNAEVLK